MAKDKWVQGADGKWVKGSEAPSGVKKDEQGNNWIINKDGIYERATISEDRMIDAAGGSGINVFKNRATQSNSEKASKFDRERVLELRGEAAKARAEDAENTPIWKRSLLAFGDELNSIYHGSKDVAYDTRLANDSFTSKYNPTGGRSSSEKESDAQENSLRRIERRQEKDLFKEMEEATLLGDASRMLPYIASGRAISAPIEKAVGKGFSAWNKFTKGAVKTGTNATGRKPFLPEFIGDLFAGAVEGAVDEDQNIFEGMGSSILGSAAGKLWAPKLERAAIDNSRYPTELVEEFVKKGYIATPGMRTGNSPIQEIFDKRSKRPTLKNKYASYKANNDKVLLNEILESSGIKKDMPDGVSLSGIKPEQMDRYLNSMGKEFDELEKTSQGIIPADSMSSIIEKAKGFKDTLTKTEYNKLKENIRLLIGDTDGGEDILFSGVDFKNNMKRLKNSSSDSMQGNKDLSDFYKEISSVYRSGLEEGMGGQKAARWNDLNERYAITKLISEKALDVNNVFDGSKLLKEMSSNDIERITRGKGGERIKRLQKVARMTDIENKQSSVDFGEGLSGLTDTERKAQEAIMGKGFITPDAGDTGFMANFLEDKRMTGWIGGPSAMTGLLNAPRDSVSRVTRALEQGNDSKLGLLNFLISDEEKEVRKKEREEREKAGGKYYNLLQQ